mmetsp:Transcript_28759/g.72263  ORF Transcript_28759/g.72263 Transcript_28759/m.72263 type:complete len:334 (-) Transcript_28759:122-1123(-)
MVDEDKRNRDQANREKRERDDLVLDLAGVKHARHALDCGIVQVNPAAGREDHAHASLAQVGREDEDHAEVDRRPTEEVCEQRVWHAEPAHRSEQEEVGDLLRDLVRHRAHGHRPSDARVAREEGRTDEDAVGEVVQRVAEEDRGEDASAGFGLSRLIMCRLSLGVDLEVLVGPELLAQSRRLRRLCAQRREEQVDDDNQCKAGEDACAPAPDGVDRDLARVLLVLLLGERAERAPVVMARVLLGCLAGVVVGRVDELDRLGEHEEEARTEERTSSEARRVGDRLRAHKPLPHRWRAQGRDAQQRDNVDDHGRAERQAPGARGVVVMVIMAVVA